MPLTWWLKKRSYFIFMMRELSSVFVALVGVGTVCHVIALKSGSDAWNALLQSPGMILFSVVALAFAVLHTVTFFTAAGQVLVIQRGDEFLPKSLVVSAHFAVWAVTSVVIGMIIL
jgi:fumarate reductase subunit C